MIYVRFAPQRSVGTSQRMAGFPTKISIPSQAAADKRIPGSKRNKSGRLQRQCLVPVPLKTILRISHTQKWS